MNAGPNATIENYTRVHNAVILEKENRPNAYVDRNVVLEIAATCSYFSRMKTVSIRDAKNRLTELAREVEKGKTVVVTRNGSPVFDLVPHKKTGGLDMAAGRAYLRSKRIKNPVPFIADDFDEPLPEDILVRPLPRG